MADNNPKNSGNKVAPLSSLTMVDPASKKTNQSTVNKPVVPLSAATFPGGIGHPIQTKSNTQGQTTAPRIDTQLQQKTVLPKKIFGITPQQNISRVEQHRNETKPPLVNESIVVQTPISRNMGGQLTTTKNPLNNVTTCNQTGQTTCNTQGNNLAALNALTFPESVVRSTLAQKPTINKTGAQPTFKVDQPIESSTYFSNQVVPANVSYGAGENYYADNSTVIPTTNRIFKYNDQLVVVETSDTVYVNTIENTLQQQYITNGVTAGVSSIIAGYGINVSSTGISGSGEVTISVADNVSGYSGYSGQPGAGLQVAGVVIDYTYLPVYAPAGTLYIILNPGGGYNAGDGAVSDGATPTSGWINTGPIQGSSGYSGISGFSGNQGYSGESGISGYSGLNGISGDSGISGYSGLIGYSGESGVSGYSGLNGYSGESGISGYSGLNGYSGESGVSGYSGQPGTGIQLAGSVIDYTYLPTYAPAGTLYIVQNSGGGFNAGDGAVSDGSSPISSWTNTGPIQGPSGVSGYSGQLGFSGYSGQSFGGDYIATIIAGTGVTVTNGTGTGANTTVAIGQPVATTDTVTFGNINVGPLGQLKFADDAAIAIIGNPTFPYAQISAAGRMYTNADALAGYALNDLKPGDYYYDDVNASIYIVIDTGLGYFDFLDLTVRGGV